MSRKLRLLFLNHNYRDEGTYYRAMPMAEHLAARGHRVTLLTVSRAQRWRATWSVVNGVKLGEMPNLGQDSSGEGYGPLDNLYRIAEAINWRFDIIHAFDHKPNATFAAFAGRLRGAKIVADWADWWGGPGGINDVPRRRVPAVGVFERWWEEESKRRADGVIAISSVLRDRAISLGCPAERVTYIPTGAAIDKIHPVPAAQARQALNLPPEQPIAGFVGIGQGDLEIVFRAIRQLDGVRLAIVGPKNDRVNVLAQQAGVADRIWQTGFLDYGKFSTYLGACDLFVLPLTDRAANRGRLPNKLLDYFCAGRPTVASPIGDVKTILDRYEVGVIARDDEFAASISALLGDPARRQRLGANARTVAETAFAWPALIDQVEAFYFSLLGGRA